MVDCVHCWHVSNVQHAILYHRDDVCCRCGEKRCVYLPQPADDGHGPFARAHTVIEP